MAIWPTFQLQQIPDYYALGAVSKIEAGHGYNDSMANQGTDPGDDQNWSDFQFYSASIQPPPPFFPNWLDIRSVAEHFKVDFDDVQRLAAIGLTRQPVRSPELDRDFVTALSGQIAAASANVSIGGLRVTRKRWFVGWQTDIPSGYTEEEDQRTEETGTGRIWTKARQIADVGYAEDLGFALIGIDLSADPKEKFLVVEDVAQNVSDGLTVRMDMTRVLRKMAQVSGDYSAFMFVPLVRKMGVVINEDVDLQALAEASITGSLSWSYIDRADGPDWWLPFGLQISDTIQWNNLTFSNVEARYGGTLSLPAGAALMPSYPPRFDV